MENCQRQRAPRIPGRRNADSVSTHRQHWCLNPSDSSQRQHRIWQVFASQYNNYGPEKVRLPDNSKVDFFATSPPRSAENIIGTEERDNLDGTLGNDIIRGLGGSDLLVGEPFGTSGNVGGRDQIFGGAGDDLIAGRGGNDILMGQKGNDIIYGDGGDDILNGGEGNNTLIGDALDASIGADVFVLQRGGFATIKDFQLGIDRIGLQQFSL
ncbi:MAG: calcium-binding protein [Leptolyngbyaceae cyanobacterium SL_1_1]|nr:calcium-binding protein [Leptolyngbyaceae cyanobacterium SL_1_1]